MSRFLLSLMFMFPSVCHAVPCDAQLGQMRREYRQTIVVNDADVPRSYWREVTLENGCKVLIVVNRRRERVVRPKPQPSYPPIEYARSRPRPVVPPTPNPVIITNPYVEQ